MKEIRRKDRAITEEEAVRILNTAEYGVLSTASENGTPYGVPISFCTFEGAIYFHCATEGRKLDLIERNNAISFCTVGNTEVLPEKFGTKYESTIVSGIAEEVFGREKQKALEELLYKYSSEFIAQGMKYIEALTDRTRVFKISVDKISGKARTK